MTFKYNNVYVCNTCVLTGPFEKKGPLSKYFDKSYDDLYFGEKTFEKAEIKLIEESITTLLNKANKKESEVDVLIGADLSNQLALTNIALSTFDIPYLGIYNACSSSGEGIIIAANMIEANQIKSAIVSASSHNLTAEKQYRQPIEYGGPKPLCSTFTATASTTILLSNKQNKIKIESATIGKVMDMDFHDVLNMGGVMASSAFYVLNKHLKDLDREISYYDLIITGDLGLYGKNILIDLIKEELKVTNVTNVDDAGILLYDNKIQKEVHAGGSGVGCGSSVLYSYIFELMHTKKLKKVLFIPTGALMNPTTVNQKISIPSISHAVSLEVIL